jgi:hypothetical protein
MFLRTGCKLPDGINLMQVQFSEKWMSVRDTIAAALDVKIRSVGWHFIWLEGVNSRFAAARTAESAIAKAITLALGQIKGHFNAAELDSIHVRKFPGFRIARITLCARQIQQQSSLDLTGETFLRQLPA